MSDSSDNNDLFYGNKFSSSINSEDIHFAQELLEKKKKSESQPQITPPPTTSGQISLGAPWKYSYKNIITYIIMENFQGITVSSVEEQVERLVKSFGEAGHPLRFKALLQNTGIPNMLLSLIVNVGQRAIQTTIDKHSFLQQRFSSNFEEIMEEVTHVDSSNELHHNKTQSSSSNTKTKNSNKILLKAVEKIYVNNKIPDDKKHHVRDIFIYDIPISWTQEKIIAELKV
ncbi:hypothetical protein RCL_jg5084.t1 [Rhizophagus clarus]|uniref:Uncharacterized protein n=1 Tax=Rhizophagus clarus TaxID=94130 RepID=A0A8H3QIR6_9GLOM|nr:hypothetical protein RCL_jg5084.t1 [Rhizophagus clarus]